MSRLVAALLTLTITQALPAAEQDEFPSDLQQWYVTDPPIENSDQKLIANHDSAHEWVVTSGGVGPQVSLRQRWRNVPSSLPFEIKPRDGEEGLAGKRTVAKVDDGFIVSFNDGEFGAGLWWFSPDGGRRYKISADNLTALVPSNSGLLALVGLAHGGVSVLEGKVVRLSRNGNGRWQTEDLIDLGHAPYVAAKDTDDTLVVATYGRLLRVTPVLPKKTEVLLDKVFWGGALPEFDGDRAVGHHLGGNGQA